MTPRRGTDAASLLDHVLPRERAATRVSNGRLLLELDEAAPPDEGLRRSADLLAGAQPVGAVRAWGDPRAGGEAHP